VVNNVDAVLSYRVEGTARERNVTSKGVEISIQHKDETSTSEDRAFGNEEKDFDDADEIGENREKYNNTLIGEITSFVSEK